MSAIQNGSYSPRPPHSPTISPARGHNQASNVDVSSKIKFSDSLMYFFEMHFEERRLDLTARFYIRQIVLVPPLLEGWWITTEGS